MSAPRIELHIDELILHGFRPADRLRIAASLESELGRLLAERGANSFTAQEVRSLDGGSFTYRTGTSPADVGRQVARSVIGGLTPS